MLDLTSAKSFDRCYAAGFDTNFSFQSQSALALVTCQAVFDHTFNSFNSHRCPKFDLLIASTNRQLSLWKSTGSL